MGSLVMCKDNNIQTFTAYLKSKYNPKAIILHGSRLGKNAFASSDHDIAIITNTPDHVSPEEYEGCLLDVFGIRPNESVLMAGNTPIWPCEIIFDDLDKLGLQLLQRTRDAYMAGPQPLTEEELENRKNYTKRLLQRLENRGEDPLIRYYYLSDLYDRIIRYWFETRGQWTQPIYMALPNIVEEDSVFYILLSKLWGPEYLETAINIYAHLFEDL
jgi:hypothetical protein